jgi:hypothetical protein
LGHAKPPNYSCVSDFFDVPAIVGPLVNAELAAEKIFRNDVHTSFSMRELVCVRKCGEQRPSNSGRARRDLLVVGEYGGRAVQLGQNA